MCTSRKFADLFDAYRKHTLDELTSSPYQIAWIFFDDEYDQRWYMSLRISSIIRGSDNHWINKGFAWAGLEFLLCRNQEDGSPWQVYELYENCICEDEAPLLPILWPNMNREEAANCVLEMLAQIHMENGTMYTSHANEQLACLQPSPDIDHIRNELYQHLDLLRAHPTEKCTAFRARLRDHQERVLLQPLTLTDAYDEDGLECKITLRGNGSNKFADYLIRTGLSLNNVVLDIELMIGHRESSTWRCYDRHLRNSPYFQDLALTPEQWAAHLLELVADTIDLPALFASHLFTGGDGLMRSSEAMVLKILGPYLTWCPPSSAP